MVLNMIPEVRFPRLPEKKKGAAAFAKRLDIYIYIGFGSLVIAVTPPIVGVKDDEKISRTG